MVAEQEVEKTMIFDKDQKLIFPRNDFEYHFQASYLVVKLKSGQIGGMTEPDNKYMPFDEFPSKIKEIVTKLWLSNKEASEVK